MSWIMILQLLIVLGALWVGSRYGSLALGAISGIGLAILVFGFVHDAGSHLRDRLHPRGVFINFVNLLNYEYQ